MASAWRACSPSSLSAAAAWRAPWASSRSARAWSYCQRYVWASRSRWRDSSQNRTARAVGTAMQTITASRIMFLKNRTLPK